MTRFTVDQGSEGQRVDRWLAGVASLSRSEVQKLISQGRVESAGEPLSKSHRVTEGEEVDLDLPAPSPSPPSDVDVPVIFEDPEIVVVSKPPDLIVHAANEGDPRPSLVGVLSQKVGLTGGEPARPGIVHRLDKDTSGLLVATKTEGAHRSLTAQLKSREMSRAYLALVEGSFRETTGRIEAPVGPAGKDPRRRAVTASGKPATTRFSVKERLDGATYLEVELDTGRTHQIRVHFAHISHPVIGDPTYGPNTIKRATQLGLSRPFLHAHRLELRHPATDELMTFTDRLPDDLAAALERARSDRHS